MDADSRIATYYIDYARRTDPSTMTFSHVHEEAFEIYYLLSGTRDYFIKDRTYRVGRGSLVLIDKNDPHRTIDGDTPEHERILLNFSEEWIRLDGHTDVARLLFPFRSGNTTLALNVQEQSYVEQLLFAMLNEQEAKKEGFELLLRTYTLQLLVWLGRLIGATSHLEREYTPINAVHGKIAAVAEHIRLHYTEPLTLSALAGTFYMNPSYLSRTFKRVTGFNIVEYIHNLRIGEAKRRLRDTGAKMIDVAEAAGFESVSRFNRVFKEQVGLPPLEYRRLTQRKSQR